MTKSFFAAVAVVLLPALAPPLAALATLGPKAIFGHLAADSFYYFTIARHGAAGAFPTFDGTHPTNGFHPLWQFVLVPLFRIVGPDQAAQLTAAFLLSVCAVTAGLVFFALAVRRLTHSALAPAWLVPGIFALVLTPHATRTVDLGLTYTSSVWAFMNGMESGLSIFFGGILAWVLAGTAAGVEVKDTAPRPSRDLSIGLLLALLALSRLDDAFLAVAFALVALRDRAPFSRVLRLAAPTVIALAVVLAFFVAATGMVLPVSGLNKTGVAVLENVTIVAKDILSPFALSASPADWIVTAQRWILVVAPMALAAFVVLRRRPLPARLTPFAPLFLYILLKGAFFIAFVRWTHQGYWAFALFVAFVNFFVIVAVSPIVAGAGRDARAAAALAWTIVFLFTGANAVSRVALPNWWFDVWSRRDLLRRELLAVRPNAKLVEFYDGLFAYSLDLPTVAASGHVTDREGRDALRAGAYPAFCLSRGFDVAVVAPEGSSTIRDWAESLDVVPLYEDAVTGVAFGGLVPRAK